MTGALALVAPLVAATAKKSSGSPIFLVLIAIAAAFYFLIYRPQQRKAKAVREVGNLFDVGDEVLTAGGIVGTVIDIDGDRVTLETSVGASFTVLKQYVLRKLVEPGAPEAPDDTEADAEYDFDDDDDLSVDDDPSETEGAPMGDDDGQHDDGQHDGGGTVDETDAADDAPGTQLSTDGPDESRTPGADGSPSS